MDTFQQDFQTHSSLTTAVLCENSITRYGAVETEEVPLKFTYIRNENDVLVPNFTSYQLACFHTKMNFYLQEDGKYSSFVSKSDGVNSRLFLEIYDSNGFVPLTLDDVSKYQPVVDRFQNHLPNHMAVFSAKRNITFQSTTLPSAWMTTIIPYLNLPNRLHNGESCEVVYENGIVLARFNDLVDYNESQRYLDKYIRDSLTRLYINGCIVLNRVKDKILIDNWKLVPYQDPEHQHSTNSSQNRKILSSNSKLYTTQWKNTLIAPQPTQFLIKLQELPDHINLLGELVECSSIDQLEDLLTEMIY